MLPARACYIVVRPAWILDREATSEQKTQKTRVADHHGGRRGAERRLRELSSLGMQTHIGGCQNYVPLFGVP